MGLLNGTVESFVQGATFGVSNLLGVTGKDGLIHDSDDPQEQAIFVDDDGLFFVENKIQIQWSDVKEIVKEQEGLYRFELRGGLIIFTGWVYWEDDEETYGEKIHDIATLPEMDIDDLGDDNVSDLLDAVSDVLWASKLADEIRGAEKLGINEGYFLRNCFLSWLVIGESVEESENATGKRARCLERLIGQRDDIVSLLKKQLHCVDSDDDDLATVVAAVFAFPADSGKGIVAQANRYDNLRNAKAYGWKFDDDEIVDVLTWNSEADGYRAIGNLQWAKRRKMIVCTDGKASLSTWSDGLRISDVMVMDAQDVNDYNDAVSDDLRLKFEVNHPRNGCTYVQHPMQQNVYIDIGSFHSSMLERKYEELKRLLDALGATSIVCDVENSTSSDEKRRRKVDAGVNVDVSVAGEFSAGGGYSGASSRMCALYKKLQTRIENRKTNEPPYVPEGLLFYQSEGGWKNLADNVLKGRRLEEETMLTYREDFAVTGQSLLRLDAKLKSVIPGYEFGVGANFSHEFEEELKQLKSTIWHYHVKFGEAQIGAVEAQPSNVVVQSAKDDYKSEETGNPKESVESRIAKIAKSYAQSECGRRNGCLTEAQRAPLEALAKKYDIDDFRFEEIIADAFVVV